MNDWLAAARRAASAPPRLARNPLSIVRDDAEHVIGSVEFALAERLHTAGFVEPTSASHWRIRGDGDAPLAIVARWLRDESVVTSWRDELLAVTDADGVVVGAIERAAVRPLGIKTWAVHLVGIAPDARVWVQQRAFDKATDPGGWDTLMGGQVAAGESIDTTLARETWEEAGLALDDLREIVRREPIVVRRDLDDGYMVEDIEVFRALIPAGVQPDNRAGEVARFECLDAADLRQRLAAGEFTLEATLILGRELELAAALR